MGFRHDIRPALFALFLWLPGPSSECNVGYRGAPQSRLILGQGAEARITWRRGTELRLSGFKHWQPICWKRQCLTGCVS